MPRGIFNNPEETRKKMSLSHIGNKSRTGQKNSAITRKRISEGLLGHPTSKETKEKLREARLKRKLELGYVNSKESREKMSKSRVGRFGGDKHPMFGKTGSLCPGWKGGLSFEPYTIEWTHTLKQSIRQRDNYTCQVCGKEPSIYVHHIDYDKKNCNPNNLITLCCSCHCKTNFNRKYWTEFFKKELLPK